MTPITIAGKEYPWPEGCKHFAYFAPDSNHDMKGEPIFQLSDTEGDWWFIKDNYCPVGILASVAARHFRNLNDKLKRDLPLEPDRMMVTPEEMQQWRARRDYVLSLARAAEQWEQLCNDI